jgi:hypothetical protein
LRNWCDVLVAGCHCKQRCCAERMLHAHYQQRRIACLTTSTVCCAPLGDKCCSSCLQSAKAVLQTL